MLKDGGQSVGAGKGSPYFINLLPKTDSVFYRAHGRLFQRIQRRAGCAVFVKRIMLLLSMVIVYCALMLGFMFVDLPIALWIYNADSMFGRFFEIIGTLPMPVVGVFSCVAWILTCDR